MTDTHDDKPSEPWFPKAAEIRLAMGEMTAAEMRVAVAAIRWVLSTRSAGGLLHGVECLKAVDALTVERADEIAEWAEQQVRIDEKMPQDMGRKVFQARMRGIAAACKIAREYLRARATHSASVALGEPCKTCGQDVWRKP